MLTAERKCESPFTRTARRFHWLDGVSGLRLLNSIGTVKTMVIHEVALNTFCIRDASLQGQR